MYLFFVYFKNFRRKMSCRVIKRGALHGVDSAGVRVVGASLSTEAGGSPFGVPPWDHNEDSQKQHKK